MFVELYESGIGIQSNVSKAHAYRSV